MLKIWSDPKLNGEVVKGIENPRYSESLKKRWTPEQRKKQGEIMCERWRDPAFKSLMSMVTSENLRYLWTDPVFSQRVNTARNDAVRKMWDTPGYRESHSGENHHNWRGGISNEPYPFEFNDKLKKRIRDRDGNKCVLCGASGRPHVHHINQDKMDSRSENLITLCPSCHGKAHYDREDWDGGLRYFHKRAKVKYYLTDKKPVEG